MVDNILREGDEVGFSSGDDGDLSGDDIKRPLFVIKRDTDALEETKEEMIDDMVDDKVDEHFVQEEYDLANNVDQMQSRLDQFDEYKHLRNKITEFHSADASAF